MIGHKEQATGRLALLLAIAVLTPCTPSCSPEQEAARSAVSSTAMNSVGYDEYQRTLDIEFSNGAVYRYFDIPVSTYRGLMSAESKGRYFHQHIRSKPFRYERLK